MVEIEQMLVAAATAARDGAPAVDLTPSAEAIFQRHDITGEERRVLVARISAAL